MFGEDSLCLWYLNFLQLVSFLKEKELLKKQLILHPFIEGNKLKYTVFSKQQQKITCKYSYGILHGVMASKFTVDDLNWMITWISSGEEMYP